MGELLPGIAMAAKASAKKGGKAVAKKPIAKKAGAPKKAAAKKTNVSKVETMNCEKVYVKPDEYGGGVPTRVCRSRRARLSSSASRGAFPAWTATSTRSCSPGARTAPSGRP